MVNLQELASITTLNSEDIMEVLISEREDDYIQLWRERISEEIRTRIETGVVTPIRILTWCIRGIGWDTLMEVQNFEKTS